MFLNYDHIYDRWLQWNIKNCKHVEHNNYGVKLNGIYFTSNGAIRILNFPRVIPLDFYYKIGSFITRMKFKKVCSDENIKR